MNNIHFSDKEEEYQFDDLNNYNDEEFEIDS